MKTCANSEKEMSSTARFEPGQSEHAAETELMCYRALTKNAFINNINFKLG